ncbi:MAG TPA: hypothetical protein VMV77_04970 [Bacteroidales bacterium]|nr:hypothetical protein [Bacteroidales bacterium]
MSNVIISEGVSGLKAILISFGVSSPLLAAGSFIEVTWVIGYFTNIKELYMNFDKSTIQSYSTICSHIKKEKYYITKDSRFLTGRYYERFNEIIIRELVTNQLYKGRKYVSLTELLAKEASNVDMQIGLGISKKF